MSLRRSRRNTVTEMPRPKSSDDQRPSSMEGDGAKGAPEEGTTMRRASTNNNLAEMEEEALKVKVPAPNEAPTDWAKQLLGMVNRSADGNTVAGTDEALLSAVTRSSAFTRHEKSPSVPEYPSVASIPATTRPTSTILHSTAAVASTHLLPPKHTFPTSSSPPSSSSSSSSSTSSSTAKAQRSISPLGSSAPTSAFVSTSALLKNREGRVTPIENRLRLRREKEQYMARAIMEEEHRKVARDREKMRELEEKMREKERIREQQEQQLAQYYEQLDKATQQQQQQQQQHSNHHEDNFAYFRSMKKKIKDINVSKNLPSIGLDEKLKKLNTRVKGFLSTTNPPSFSLPINKFRDKRAKGARDSLPIKLNVVDDFMKDLEMQRRGEEERPGGSLESQLSPIGDSRRDHAAYEIDSNASSSPNADVQKKHVSGRVRTRRAIMQQKLANKSTSDLRVLAEALERDMQKNNEDLVATQAACSRLRAEMEATKTMLTTDVSSACGKVSRAGMTGQQLSTTVQDIRSQLDMMRSATSSCSDQIKLLEVRVQKVQRTKKKTDVVMKWIVRVLLAVLGLYLVIHSRVAQVLAALSILIMITRAVKESRFAAKASANPITASPPPSIRRSYEPPPREDSRNELTNSSESAFSDTSPEIASSDGTYPHSNPPTPPVSSMRRNHSDLVLQSLLNEGEFLSDNLIPSSEAPLGSSRGLKSSISMLPPVAEHEEHGDKDSGIAPRVVSPGTSPSSNKAITTDIRTSANYSGGIRTSATYSSGLRSSSAGNPARNNSKGGSSSSSGKGSSSSKGGNSGSNTKDSVAMNLALHNLNQMSLKIQQMQQGK